MQDELAGGDTSYAGWTFDYAGGLFKDQEFRGFALVGQTLVDDIEHLQKGGM